MVLIGNAALHTNELLSDGSVFAPLMCSARTKMSLPMRLLYLMLSDKSFIESCRKSRTIFGRSKNKEAVVNGSNGTHTSSTESKVRLQFKFYFALRVPSHVETEMRVKKAFFALSLGK
mmetsp:Transcript_29464/g.43867  ORF Transcript_29464/g.43867 Transcript_29464/m.43867 type:complete len:118 (-) Transcript_29464:94-447(-)